MLSINFIIWLLISYYTLAGLVALLRYSSTSSDIRRASATDVELQRQLSTSSAKPRHPALCAALRPAALVNPRRLALLRPFAPVLNFQLDVLLRLSIPLTRASPRLLGARAPAVLLDLVQQCSVSSASSRHPAAIADLLCQCSRLYASA